MTIWLLILMSMLTLGALILVMVAFISNYRLSVKLLESLDSTLLRSPTASLPTSLKLADDPSMSQEEIDFYGDIAGERPPVGFLGIGTNDPNIDLELE